jgi:3-phenylpropionate/trans-cinnamate dioxygenase ferredoxin reductase component
MRSEAMVIIGAGECGARAAQALREEGFAGPVTLIGAEPHAPYERPPLSKSNMTNNEATARRTIISHEKLAELGIDFMLGIAAIAIDRTDRCVTLSNGERLSYTRLLLATGARPRKLPMPGADGPNCVYLRSYDDCARIRRELHPGRRIAIIGGGFIGLEVAASASQRGAKVTVIEAQPRLLARCVPEEIAGVVMAEHLDRGVEIRCGETLTGIEHSSGETVLHCGSGTIAADLVLIGIGAVPETAIADAAGLECANGIAVDDRLRTADPHIFAAGDCCSFPLSILGHRRVRLESWRSAQDQGALAARNMLGRDEPHAAVPWFWSDQYELTLQIAGLVDERTTVVRRDLGYRAFILFHLADDGRLVAASGIGTGNAAARDIRIAEMLIARGARPAPIDLAAHDFKLKKLLAD